MTKNMGTGDRIVRSIVSLVLLFLILTGAVEGAAAIVLGIVAAVMLLTSAVSVCPAYLPFKFSTLKGRARGQ